MVTTGQVTQLVTEIITKSAVGVPTAAQLLELGIQEEPILVLAPEDADVGFDTEEDSLFAEILFLEEEARRAPSRPPRRPSFLPALAPLRRRRPCAHSAATELCCS